MIYNQNPQTIEVQDSQAQELYEKLEEAFYERGVSGIDAVSFSYSVDQPKLNSRCACHQDEILNSEGSLISVKTAHVEMEFLNVPNKIWDIKDFKFTQYDGKLDLFVREFKKKPLVGAFKAKESNVTDYFYASNENPENGLLLYSSSGLKRIWGYIEIDRFIIELDFSEKDLHYLYHIKSSRDCKIFDFIAQSIGSTTKLGAPV